MPTNYNINAPRDDNQVPADLFEIVGQPGYVAPGQIDETTGRILVDLDGIVLTGAQIAAHFQTDVFTSTNNQTTFVPTYTLVQDNGMYVNGARQTPSTDYSIIGGQYVLNQGIPSGCAVILEYIY
jgi:hypothetical protein